MPVIVLSISFSQIKTEKYMSHLPPGPDVQSEQFNNTQPGATVKLPPE